MCSSSVNDSVPTHFLARFCKVYSLEEHTTAAQASQWYSASGEICVINWKTFPASPYQNEFVKTCVLFHLQNTVIN